MDLVGGQLWSSLSGLTPTGVPHKGPRVKPSAVGISPGNQGRRGLLAMLAKGQRPGTVSVPTGSAPELSLGAPAGMGQYPGSQPLGGRGLAALFPPGLFPRLSLG